MRADAAAAAYCAAAEPGARADVRLFDARDDWRDVTLHPSTHVEWEQIQREAAWTGNDVTAHFLEYMRVATRLDLAVLEAPARLDLAQLEALGSEEDNHILLLGSGREDAFEQEVGSLYDLLVEGLHLRNVAIVQGGLGAMVPALVALGHGARVRTPPAVPEKLPGLLHRVAGALPRWAPFAPWRAALEVDCAPSDVATAAPTSAGLGSFLTDWSEPSSSPRAEA